MSDIHLGSCFCGSVQIETRGAPVETGYCHCASCRAYAGGPFTAFTLWPDAQVRVLRGAEFLTGFNRQGTSDRHFCIRCGGSVMTRHPGFGFTDVPAGVLPTVNFVPTVHLNYAEAVVPFRDGLPKLRDFPANAGGSGDAMAE